MSLLQLHSISKHFGGLAANQDVSFNVDAGQIVGLIGPNGAGKTTTFNCVAGYYAPSAGSITLDGRTISGLAPEACARAGIGRTFQLVRPFPALSVEDNVVIGALMLLLVSAIPGLGFQVNGIIAAFLGAIIIAIVGLVLSWILPD